MVRMHMGSSVAKKRLVQELWSGYGELCKVKLADGRRIVVKHITPPRDDGSLSHRRKLASYDVERAFYETYAARSCARVAELIHSSAGFLVLEDLDEAGFAGRKHRLGSIDAVRPLVRWLAAFHKSFMNEDNGAQGCYWHLDTRPDELARTAGPLKDAAVAIDRALKSARHTTLVHGDAKIANFCFGATGVAAVDFQYVGVGVGVRDLAYLLGSCLSGTHLAAFADDLLDYYFAHLDEGEDVEVEWRALWPYCFADFERFLAGWAPGHWKRNSYTQRMTDEVLLKIP